MTTRHSTRQELKDLAKLAATMPKEAPPKPARPDLPRPPTPSSASASFSLLTVPPSVASVPPPAPEASVNGKKRSGALLAVFATVGVAVAVAGGVQIGKYFAHRGPATSAAVNAPIVVTPPGALATPPVTAPAAAPPPADPPPVAAAAAPPADPVAPVAATRTTPLPLVHRGQAPAGKPAPTAAKASSLTANIPASAGTMDPLEAAIRKAVANGPQK